MKRLCLVVFLCIFSTGLRGQSYQSGEDWEFFPKNMKIAFVMGMVDGAIASFCSIVDVKMVKSADEVISRLAKSTYYCQVRGGTYEQIIEGLDDFYKDFANKHIPVFALATLVRQKIDGSLSDAQVAEKLQKLRAQEW